MSKYSLSFVFVFIFPAVLFLGCQENEHPEKPVWPPNSYYRYVLFDIQADRAIDINFDGTANVDLMKEIDLFTYNCAVFFEKTDHNPILDVIWPEVRVNNGLLLSEVPTTYSDTMLIEYYPVQISYYFILNKERTHIIPEGKLVQDFREHYTFVYPRVLDIDKNKNIITFQTEQSFLVKEGLAKRTLTAKFKPGTPDDVFK